RPRGDLPLGGDLLLAASADNVLVASLVVPGLLAEGLVAPAIDRSLSATDRRLRLTTTVWVVSGRLDDTANVRLATESPVLTGFTDRFVLMLGVTHFTDGGAAGVVHHSHFTAGKSKGDVVP